MSQSQPDHSSPSSSSSRSRFHGRNENNENNGTSKNNGQSLGQRIARLQRFLTRDLWKFDANAHRVGGSRALTFTRWLYLVLHSFVADQCLLRAVALAYTTIISIAPFLAVAFSISKGLGLQNTEFIREALLRLTAERTEMVDRIIGYINNTSVETLGAVGVLILFAAVISVMGNIESALNTIWGVRQGRTLWRKFTDFFSVTLISPAFMLAAVSLSVSLQNDTVVQSILAYEPFSMVFVWFLKALPSLLMWLALFFLYVFIPNTRVNLKAAAMGSFAAMVMWRVAEWFYISYQVGVTKYNAIYGSFAQFPLFLLWLYIAWVIVLLGAVMSFSLQNLRTFQGEVIAARVSPYQRDQVAVLLMLCLTRRFMEHLDAPSVDELAERLHVPVKLVQDLFTRLMALGLAVHLQDDDDGQERYTLAAPPQDIRITDVVGGLSRTGYGACEAQSEVRDLTEAGDLLDFSGRLGFIESLFDELMGAAKQSPANRTLAEEYATLREAGQAESL